MCSRSAARRKCSSSASDDERAQLPQLHRRMIGDASHSARDSSLIARAPRSYGPHMWRESRVRLPVHGDVARSSGRSTSRTRSASTSAPAPSSPCSSARSSASGSSRATRTSGRSSRSPATFSSENTQAPYKPRPPEVAAGPRRGRASPRTRGSPARQPPDHTRLRGFIKKAFTPRRVAVLEPQIREIATRMIDEFDARGEPRRPGRRARLRAPRAGDLPPARRPRRGRPAT